LGKPMLLRQIERVMRARTLDDVIVATTRLQHDDVLAELAESAGVAVHRGSQDDVLGRFVGAARQARADVVVRLTGDCPLADPALIDETVDAYMAGQPEIDFASNALGETYPDGMDTEVFSFRLLERAGKDATLPSEREHVTFWFWKTRMFSVRRVDAAHPRGDVRLTVDYPEDLDVVRAIYERLYPADPAFGLAEILAVVDEVDTVVPPARRRNDGWQTAIERDHQWRRAHSKATRRRGF